MQRSVERRDVRIGAVHGQSVLGEVVGTDRKEIELIGQLGGGEHRRRHFHHGPDLDAGIAPAHCDHLFAFGELLLTPLAERWAK